MSIDSYIYFNQRLTNSLINEVINKINDDKNYKLDLISGPVKGSVTSKSKIHLNFDFKYSIIYLIISIIFFLLIIICCPTEYITDAPVFYQRLSDISFVLLVLNIPVFIAPIVIEKVKK